MTTRPCAVAFQGETGAYGEEAALHLAPGLPRLGLLTFEAVLDSVRLGDARFGVVPVENVYAGPVSGVVESWQRSDTFIAADLWLPVHHVLAGLPGARLGAITLVRSHPQALAQCAPYLASHGMTPVASTNTATAARELSEGARLSEAVIASPAAARRFGLQVLASDVSAAPGNRTRFWLLDREPHPPGVGTGLRFTAVARIGPPGSAASALAGIRRGGGRTERVMALSDSSLLIEGAASSQKSERPAGITHWSVYPRRAPPS